MEVLNTTCLPAGSAACRSALLAALRRASSKAEGPRCVLAFPHSLDRQPSHLLRPASAKLCHAMSAESELDLLKVLYL